MKESHLLRISLSAVFLLAGFSLFAASPQPNKPAVSGFEENFYSALKERAAENYLTAVIYLRSAIAADSTQGGAYHELSKNYLSLKDLPQAIEAAQKAYELSGGERFLGEVLLGMYLQQGQYDKAAALLENIPIYGKDFYTEFARVYLLAGNPAKALEVLSRYDKEYGRDTDVDAMRLEIYMDSYPKKALWQINNTLKDRGEDPRTGLQKVLLLYKLKKTRLADRYLLTLEERYPDDPLLISLGIQRNVESERYGLVFSTLASFITNADITSAQNKRKLMLDLSDKYSTDSLWNVQYGQALEAFVEGDEDSDITALKGEYYFQSGEKEKGITYLRRSVALGKIDFGWQANVMIRELNAGLYDTLLIDSSHAIDIFPDQPAVYFLHGMALSGKKQYAEAIPILQKAEQISSSLPDLQKDIRSSLANAYHETGQYERADSLFNSLLAEDPDNAMVTNNYAYFLSVRGEQLPLALTMIEKVIKKEGNNPTYADTYAWVLYRMGECGKALGQIEKAIEDARKDDQIPPESLCDMYDHYGDILWCSGQKGKAVQMWEKALSVATEEQKQTEIERKINNGTEP